MNGLEGWADEGHKEGGKDREGASFPYPSLFSPFSLFNYPPGHGDVHVYVHVNVWMG